MTSPTTLTRQTSASAGTLSRPQTHRPARSRLLAGLGATAITTGMVAILALHVIAPTSGIDWYRRTISEYAYSSLGWVFDTSVVLISAGSLLVLGGLLASRVVAGRSVSAVGLLAWSVALVVIVIFPKHDWSIGPSTHGAIHRIASIVAFSSVPIAAIVAAVRGVRGARGGGRGRTPAFIALFFGTISGALFAGIIGAVVLPLGQPWYRVFPLGLMERGIAGAGIFALLSLAVLALTFRPGGDVRSGRPSVSR